MVNHNNGERNTDVDSRLRQKEQDKLLFHDFLGSKTAILASTSMADHRIPPDKAAKPAMTLSTASASSAGGRGGLSSTSDLVERKGGGGNHLDAIQLFGSRSEVSGSIMSNRFPGNKRSNSDSHFTTQEHPETLHWSKLPRNGPGSLSMNVNPLANQPPRGGGQISLLLHQLSTSRFKDENMGPSVIAQTAADEGSRTGMKGSGILSSFTMPNPSKLECLAPSSTGNRKDLTSNTKQMTIFYGGQAHVFDDVHPNKADVIMALAGSSGGSWSTGLSQKPKTMMNNTSDGPYKLGQMYEGGSSRETPFLAPEFRPRPGHQATSGACHQNFTRPGREHQGSIISRGRDIRDTVHISDPEKKPHD
uniref:Protein TIFY n=1 Tax=Noccaea caerulescens TaxID=107243 RepID=A0A1J3HR13_NOCCA